MLSFSGFQRQFLLFPNRPNFKLVQMEGTLINLQKKPNNFDCFHEARGALEESKSEIRPKGLIQTMILKIPV